jgi:hypothetical protein
MPYMSEEQKLARERYTLITMIVLGLAILPGFLEHLSSGG